MVTLFLDNLDLLYVHPTEFAELALSNENAFIALIAKA